MNSEQSAREQLKAETAGTPFKVSGSRESLRPTSHPAAIANVDLGPVTVKAVEMAGALGLISTFVENRWNCSVAFCEASLLSSTIKDERVRRAVRSADAVFPDGIALMALARLRGVRLPGRITGPGFMLAACEYGLSRGWRHYFYGAGPGIADQLAARLSGRFPGLQVAGTFTPPFRPLTSAEELEIEDRIEASLADLLWVALGSPKQELWVSEHVGKISVPVMLAVGAAFDFHSGNRPWAPPWVRKIGIEWAHRAVTGGRRTFLRNLNCVTTVGCYLAVVAAKALLGLKGKGHRDL